MFGNETEMRMQLNVTRFACESSLWGFSQNVARRLHNRTIESDTMREFGELFRWTFFFFSIQ